MKNARAKTVLLVADVKSSFYLATSKSSIISIKVPYNVDMRSTNLDDKLCVGK